MNDFTKTDLTEIHRCLKYMTKGGTTPYSCHTVALVKKLRGMIENYCELEECPDCRLAKELELAKTCTVHAPEFSQYIPFPLD